MEKDKRMKVGNKVAGDIRGDTFVKIVLRERHYFRKFGGYAINTAILNELPSLNVKYIRIIEKDTHREYLTTVENFILHGTKILYGKEPQIVLRIGMMQL